MSTKTMNLLDVNPLEHITGDIAISQYNYESILNGLVQWDQCKSDKITIRIATRTEPYFVDYEIPTKYFYDKNYGENNAETLLATDSFAYETRMMLSIAKDDKVTLRLNVRDAGNTKWKLYKNVVVYDEFNKVPTDVNNVYMVSESDVYKRSYEPGLYIRIFKSRLSPNGQDQFKLYKTVDNISAGDNLVPTDTTKLVEVTHMQTNTSIPEPVHSEYPLFCIPTGASANVIVYARNESVETVRGRPLTENDAYVDYCRYWQEGVSYKKGTVVYFKGDFYVSLIDNPGVAPVIFTAMSNTTQCTYDLDSWEPVLLVAVDNESIQSSKSYRFTADTDIAGYVLRNIGTESSATTSINIFGSINIVGDTSKQPTGLNILSTSNYADWPTVQTTKWSSGSVYTADPNKSAYDKQDYSAVMTFNHIDADLAYKHIINYDGPDVDQGLCIMLPVTVLGDNNVEHDPKDGMMLEFLFNIWPNPAYGKVDNDLIINKSQIYVYNVSNYADYLQYGFSPSTVTPIAKFSMARLINFYVFSENIGVPDRPVCYKARFIYSKTEHQWKTYDYYQMPDHIFMSPYGFVDPSDKKAYDVESAGFPLYQNPFSSYDMSPIHVDKSFLNQIQNIGQ